jgi:hypothetical protein
MNANTDGNKVSGNSVAPTWRIDFRRMTATDEVRQWAKERGTSRAQPGTPPLFVVGDAAKEEAMKQFEGLDPVATEVSAGK